MKFDKLCIPLKIAHILKSDNRCSRTKKKYIIDSFYSIQHHFNCNLSLNNIFLIQEAYSYHMIFCNTIINVMITKAHMSKFLPITNLPTPYTPAGYYWFNVRDNDIIKYYN